MPRNKPTFLAREGLASRLASDVIERIAREEISPGERLPTEAEIATQYGVSRTVVREAISRLRADGVVTARPGAGTFVTPTGWSRSFRIDPSGGPAETPFAHVLELRMAFEVEAARLAAERRQESDLDEMRHCLSILAADMAGTEEGIDADVRFHRSIALATRNPLYSDFFDFIDPHIRREIRQAREKTARLSQSRAAGLWLQAQGEHVAILAAIEAANPTKAAAAARIHIRNTVKRLRHGQAAPA
jgi:GntR family transcriptional regulator, transcriptional repressor for pyruvate dehydrogenase complex